MKYIIKLVNRLSWDACIEKSKKMFNTLNNPQDKIITTRVTFRKELNNFEVICVDSKSTDGSIERAKSFLKLKYFK